VQPSIECHGIQVVVYTNSTSLIPGNVDADSQITASQKNEAEPRVRSRSRSQFPTARKRDARGRFSSNHAAANASPRSRREKSNGRSRSRSPVRSKALQMRDLNDRFGGSCLAATESPPKARERPRGRTMEIGRATTKSLNASAQRQDARGVFSGDYFSATSNKLTPPTSGISDKMSTETSRPRSRSVNGTLQKRDSKGRGRFSGIDTVAEVVAKQKQGPKKTLSPERSKLANGISQKRDSKDRFGCRIDRRSMTLNKELSPTATPTPAVKGRDEMGVFQKAFTNFKKTPAKSPYFDFVSSSPKTIKSNNPSLEDSEPTTRETPEKLLALKSPTTPKAKVGQETPKKPRTPGGVVSCIPFPPLSSPYFGLIQEKLAHEPFRLLIAVTFLIRTHGKHAIPVFYELMEKYPTPESLVCASKDDIVPLIRHLGLQNQRAGTYQTYAKIWVQNPPVRGKRYAVRDYPTKGSGKDIGKDEVLPDDDKRVAWEIGHMTQGPYAIDSWRIFCRDVLRGVAGGWNGEGAQEGFQPEWMRVLPQDKELRAYLRWMWLKEGFEWDPFTGEKEVASERLMRAAMEGRIAWDDMGGISILNDTDDDVLSQAVQSLTT
jgi:methyl-CpG-binding domain protein 4